MHDCTITRRQLWLQAMQRLLALVLPLVLLGLIGKLQSTQDKIFLVQLQATSATCTIIFLLRFPVQQVPVLLVRNQNNQLQVM